MNRIQKVIILSWLVLIAAVICLYMEWRYVDSMMLWAWLFLRGFYLNEKENNRKYFSNRKGLMIFNIIATIAPFLWFLFQMVTESNISKAAWILIGLSFVPFLILMMIYDRWLYLNNDCKVSPRYNQDSQLR